MTPLQMPKTLLLDASTLAAMSADFASTEFGANERLAETLDRLDSGGWIPTLTSHQVIELLRHENPRVSEERFRFLVHLSSRPQIAWFTTVEGDQLGSVADLLATELEAVVKAGHSRTEDVIEYARDRLFRFGSAPLGHWTDLDALRPWLTEQMSREREIVSIAQASIFDPSMESIGQLRRTKTRGKTEAAALMTRFVPGLGQELEATGEKRLTNPADVAADFLGEVQQGILSIPDDQTPIDGILQLAGLDPTEVPDEMTFEEALDFSDFRNRIVLVGRYVGVELDHLRHVRPQDLPSWRAQRAVRELQLAAVRAQGGDLTDSYLVAFLPYVDHATVDKRTQEYLRQARRRTELSGLLGASSKLSDYGDLPEMIGSPATGT